MSQDMLQDAEIFNLATQWMRPMNTHVNIRKVLIIKTALLPLQRSIKQHLNEHSVPLASMHAFSLEMPEPLQCK